LPINSAARFGAVARIGGQVGSLPSSRTAVEASARGVHQQPFQGLRLAGSRPTKSQIMVNGARFSAGRFAKAPTSS